MVVGSDAGLLVAAARGEPPRHSQPGPSPPKSPAHRALRHPSRRVTRGVRYRSTSSGTRVNSTRHRLVAGCPPHASCGVRVPPRGCRAGVGGVDALVGFRGRGHAAAVVRAGLGQRVGPAPGRSPTRTDTHPHAGGAVGVNTETFGVSARRQTSAGALPRMTPARWSRPDKKHSTDPEEARKSRGGRSTRRCHMPRRTPP